MGSAAKTRQCPLEGCLLSNCQLHPGTGWKVDSINIDFCSARRSKESMIKRITSSLRTAAELRVGFWVGCGFGIQEREKHLPFQGAGSCFTSKCLLLCATVSLEQKLRDAASCLGVVITDELSMWLRERTCFGDVRATKNVSGVG